MTADTVPERLMQFHRIVSEVRGGSPHSYGATIRNGISCVSASYNHWMDVGEGIDKWEVYRRERKSITYFVEPEKPLELAEGFVAILGNKK